MSVKLRAYGKYGVLLVSLTTFVCIATGATLTLTPAGIADGFTLTTFATTNPGNTGCCSGPFGVAVASNGNIIVSTGSPNNRYVFADVDGQTTGSALHTVTPSSSSTVAYATAGGHAYGGVGGHFVEFNDDGTVNHILTGVTPGTSLGMWGNPVNGHIIATSGSGLIDIDPLANGGNGSFRIINSQFGDGVSVSPDGTIVYLEQGNIIGYSIATGAQVFNSGPLAGSSGGPDGTGVITSSNALNGMIVVNFNGNGVNTGEIGLLDPVTKNLVIIANGGTRGDYVSPDTNNGSLFLDYSDVVYRLSCGPDCAIGGPPPPPPSGVPEPGTWGLIAAGLGSIVLIRIRKV